MLITILAGGWCCTAMAAQEPVDLEFPSRCTALGPDLGVAVTLIVRLRPTKGDSVLITLWPETTKGKRGGEIALLERLRRKAARLMK